MLKKLQKLTSTLLISSLTSFSALAAGTIDTTQSKGAVTDKNNPTSCVPEFSQLDSAFDHVTGLKKINEGADAFDVMQSLRISVQCDSPIMLFLRHKDLVPVAYIWTEEGTRLPGMFRVLNSDINFHILEKGQAIELTVPPSMNGLTTFEFVYF